MNELLANESDAAWKQIAPHLDTALGDLSDADRDAVLLRYFEKKSAQEMAAVLGVSAEAAQKRVNRAVDRLRELFAKRGVAVGASGLVILLSANAVQAAPTGLAVAISATTLVGATVSTSTFVTAATKTIAMTTLQKILVTATVAILAGAGVYEAHQASLSRNLSQTFQQQQESLAREVQQLSRERDAATNRLAVLSAELAKGTKNPTEVLKLRGEVGALRQQKKVAGEKSALNKVTADPESRKLLRDQQKVGMSSVYADFAKRLNLSPEMTDKLNDLLADDVMDNVDLITQALRDGRSQTEVRQIFAAAENALQSKIQALLGDDALAQYKNYTQNLGSRLTAAQFAGYLSGDAAGKQEKQNQLEQLLQRDATAALKNAGLPSDYQIVPMLNFANIASEDQARQSLDLLDGIYASVAADSANFLTPEEIANFQNFRTNALTVSRSMLSVNRNLMAPIGN